MEAGPCTGTLVARSEIETVSTNNVVATLPGGSDSWVLIGSHHDGPWASAVEDASGVALVRRSLVLPPDVFSPMPPLGRVAGSEEIGAFFPPEPAAARIVAGTAGWTPVQPIG
jgi:hypothetical protein